MRYDKETRERVASEVVLGGRSVSEVSREHGISYQNVYNWVRALERSREAERATADERARRLAEAVSGRPGEVVLLELETGSGRTLVMVDRRRDGAPSGTVRRIAGDTLGGGPLSGEVKRRWVVDLASLVRAVAAAVSNDPGSTTTQRKALRVMTGGEE